MFGLVTEMYVVGIETAFRYLGDECFGEAESI